MLNDRMQLTRSAPAGGVVMARGRSSTFAMEVEWADRGFAAHVQRACSVVKRCGPHLDLVAYPLLQQNNFQGVDTTTIYAARFAARPTASNGFSSSECCRRNNLAATHVPQFTAQSPEMEGE